MDCIFCKIIKKEAPATIIYENDSVVVFENIKPATPIHLLAVPKKHIESVNHIEEEDKELIGEVFLAVHKAVEKVGIKYSGYKLTVHVGEGGGQEIFHLHVHVLGGWNNK